MHRARHVPAENLRATGFLMSMGEYGKQPDISVGNVKVQPLEHLRNFLDMGKTDRGFTIDLSLRRARSNQNVLADDPLRSIRLNLRSLIFGLSFGACVREIRIWSRFRGKAVALASFLYFHVFQWFLFASERPKAERLVFR
jgi:hypothetical protein